jgi:cell division control protein 45
MDSHRPWNLGNVFGGYPPEPETDMAPDLSMRYQHGVKGGRIDRAYKPGKGGIIVFDDGDIEDNLAPQGVAYLALLDMPDVEDDGHDIGDSDGEQDEDLFSEEHARAGQKRKSWSDREEDDESSGDDDRPAQRRRSNSVSLLGPLI